MSNLLNNFKTSNMILVLSLNNVKYKKHTPTVFILYVTGENYQLVPYKIGTKCNKQL